MPRLDPSMDRAMLNWRWMLTFLQRCQRLLLSCADGRFMLVGATGFTSMATSNICRIRARPIDLAAQSLIRFAFSPRSEKCWLHWRWEGRPRAARPYRTGEQAARSAALPSRERVGVTFRLQRRIGRSRAGEYSGLPGKRGLPCPAPSRLDKANTAVPTTWNARCFHPLHPRP